MRRGTECYCINTRAQLLMGNTPARPVPPTPSADKWWREIEVGSSQRDGPLESKVLWAPGVLSREECDELVTAVNKHIVMSMTSYVDSSGRMRVPIAHLKTDAARGICQSLLRDRVIEFLEHDVPDVALRCFGQSSGLRQMRCVFSTIEPTVNRYTRGGDFKPHQDKQQLTVLLHLSAAGDFEGGGTAFWPEGQTPGTLVEGSEVVVHPAQGDALYWHGDLTHAARVVERGRRHILVCSFSLFPATGDGAAPSRVPYACMGIPGTSGADAWPRYWSV